jgi:hypothetical protein
VKARPCGQPKQVADFLGRNLHLGIPALPQYTPSCLLSSPWARVGVVEWGSTDLFFWRRWHSSPSSRGREVANKPQSFPRKRESARQSFGNAPSKDWIPAFAGMTGVSKGIPSQMTPPPSGEVEWPRELLHGCVMWPTPWVQAGQPSLDRAKASLARNRVATGFCLTTDN